MTILTSQHKSKTNGSLNKNNRILSLFLISSLFVSASLLNASETTKKDLFIEKYIKKDSKSFKAGEAVLSNRDRARLSKGVDLATVTKQDINNTSFDVDYTSALNNQTAKDIANEINLQTRSKKHIAKVKKYEEYLLEDKELDFKDKMGSYYTQVENIKKYKTAKYKNSYLGYDERVIIAISSSIPMSTLKNYFDSLSEVYSDVSFVLNGFIGNNPKYVMPTVKYISKLLDKRNLTKKHSEKDKYLFRVDINPKIFMKYSLERVPAVIFIKNYNPYSEIQGNTYSIEKNGLDKEEVYIGYGDSNIKYVFEKINKKAKSKGLSKLIKNINKGFFNE